jgi:hypothetical protein
VARRNTAESRKRESRRRLGGEIRFFIICCFCHHLLTKMCRCIGSMCPTS